ncbi:MAG: DUF6273 domain-containing protein, partial [Firmicutes bacterium]|nr:DUF6273 domain-containing protein [Bacillota bacterium]
MQNKKTSRLLSFAVVIAFVLMANLAVSGLVLKTNREMKAAAVDAKLGRVTDIKVGDYVEMGKGLDDKPIMWRVITDDAGDLLLRSDRALADTDGSTLYMPFDDPSIAYGTAGYAGNVASTNYVNTSIGIQAGHENQANADLLKKYDRTVTGTNLWGQSSIRAWLNDGFMNQAFNEDEQAMIVDKAQKQIVSWIDASDDNTLAQIRSNNGIAASKIVDDTQRYAQKTANAKNINLITKDKTNDGTDKSTLVNGVVDNKYFGENHSLTEENPNAGVSNAYKGEGGLTQNSLLDGFGYTIKDKVTMQDLSQIQVLQAGTDKEVLRNANGQEYGRVLQPNYNPANSVNGDANQGRASIMTRSPATMADLTRSNEQWNFAGRTGSAIRVMAGKAYTNSATGATAIGPNKFWDLDSAGREKGWSMAPTIWISKADAANFAHEYDASTNPGEKENYKIFTNNESAVNDQSLSGTMTSHKIGIADTKIAGTTQEGNSNLVTDDTAQPLVYLAKTDLEITGVINDIIGTDGNFSGNDTITDIRLNGVGAFPRGLQIVVENAAAPTSRKVSIIGAAGLVDLKDRTVNTKGFEFQVAIDADTIDGTKTVTTAISLDVTKGDPSWVGGTLAKRNATTGNLVYSKNPGGAADNSLVYGPASNIVFDESTRFTTFAAITDEDEMVDNVFA